MGYAVTVVDPAPQPGGLASRFSVGGGSVERFYHHVFRSDTTAQEWIRDLGLGEKLEFLPSTMGFYSGGTLRGGSAPRPQGLAARATVVYLGRYAPPEDPLLALTDEAIARQFLDAAADAFSPGFAQPLAMHVFRAPAAQPLVPPGWESNRPTLASGMRGLVVANMAQIYPWDRGINYSIDLGKSAARAISDDRLAVPTPPSRYQHESAQA